MFLKVSIRLVWCSCIDQLFFFFSFHRRIALSTNNIERMISFGGLSKLKIVSLGRNLIKKVLPSAQSMKKCTRGKPTFDTLTSVLSFFVSYCLFVMYYISAMSWFGTLALIDWKAGRCGRNSRRVMDIIQSDLVFRWLGLMHTSHHIIHFEQSN